MPERPVIANSTPLVSLWVLDRLDLLLAKERGLVARLAPLLEELRTQGLYLGAALVDQALRVAGEV